MVYSTYIRTNMNIASVFVQNGKIFLCNRVWCMLYYYTNKI